MMFKNLFVVSNNDISANDVLKKQWTHASGLTLAEACKRGQFYGMNHMPAFATQSLTKQLLADVQTPISFVLLAGVGVSQGLGISGLAFIIGLLWSVVFGIRFYATWHFNQQVRQANAVLTSEFLVIRDGISRRVSGMDLVPGDMLMLGAGDRLPANVCFFEDSHLTLDSAQAVFGAEVLAGEGYAVVLATGSDVLARPLVKHGLITKLHKALQSFAPFFKSTGNDNDPLDLPKADQPKATVDNKITQFLVQINQIHFGQILDRRQPRVARLTYESSFIAFDRPLPSTTLP